MRIRVLFQKRPSWKFIPWWLSAAILSVAILWIFQPYLWPGGFGFGKEQSVITRSIEKVEKDKQGNTAKSVETTKYDDGKTLWDLLGLLGAPLSLVVLGYWLQQIQQKRSEEVAKAERDRAAAETRREILQVYFDRISAFLVDKNLLAIATRIHSVAPVETEGLPQFTATAEERELLDSATVVIRAITLSILRTFEEDTECKTRVARFLIEADIVSKLKLSLAYADLRNADLRGAKFTRADLTGVNLSGANLQGADLSSAYITGADLSSAKLNLANLNGTYLINSKLNSATLDGVDLSGANLTGADLIEAHLTNANLKGATLINANFSNAVLSHANLSSTTLNGVNLSGADLTEADLNSASLNRTKFIGANLTKAQLVEADLSGATLIKANFTEANLKDANLSSAELIEANFTKAILYYTKFMKANLTKANLTEANLVGAVISSDELKEALLCNTTLVDGITKSDRDCEKLKSRGKVFGSAL